MKFAIWLGCTLSCVYIARGYNILALFPIPSQSHNTLGKGIVDALLDAGHQVTWATPFPTENVVNGLTIIDISGTLAHARGIDVSNPASLNRGIAYLRNMSRNITRTVVSTPAVREAIVHGKFDAVVTEYFISEIDAGFAAVMQVPWILLNGELIIPTLEKQLDDIRSISTIPLMLNRSPIPMSFFQRLYNTFLYTKMTISTWFDYPNVLELYESLFAPLAAAKGVQLPAFSDAFYNVSILLLNSHPSFAPAYVLPPNVVEIGGYHIANTTQPLPEDFQILLDSAKQGFIYFSMGSVMKSSSLPAHTKRELLDVFGKLPYTVLWKFEEQLEDLPTNVHIRSWMPQSSILAHPNVKLFITHGGLLSTFETLHYGVPQIVIPLFGDQPANANKAVNNGYAQRVTFSHSMAGDIKEAIEEMMGNDKYYKKAKFLSKLFNNRPIPPSKLISHYVEVAIESKGAYHLRSKSLLYSWYERAMLDQLVFLLVILYIVYRVLRTGVQKLIRKKCDTNKVKEN